MTNEQIQEKFIKFNEEISLSQDQIKKLNDKCLEIRERISDYFYNNLNKQKIEFFMQGSFADGIIIRSNEDYDADYGVYLLGYSDKQLEQWPNISEYYDNLKEAVDGIEGQIKIEKKNNCIRVYFEGFHIDLPLYIEKDGDPYVARANENEWKQTGPKKFTKWFASKVQNLDDNGREGDQLKRCVKYVKKWKDEKKVNLKGMEITILVANNFFASDNNDLKALKETINNIFENLKNEFCCMKPVPPREDFFAVIGRFKSEKEKQLLMQDIESLKSVLESAENLKDISNLSNIFGESFGLKEEQNPKIYQYQKNI